MKLMATTRGKIMEMKITGRELTKMFEDWCKELPLDHPYQPDSSKREDASNDAMRYSEHGSNIVREVQ